MEFCLLNRAFKNGRFRNFNFKCVGGISKMKKVNFGGLSFGGKAFFGGDNGRHKKIENGKKFNYTFYKNNSAILIRNFSRNLSYETKEKKNETKKIDRAKKANFLDTPVGSSKIKRWKMIIPTIMIHLSIGSIYSWSMYNSALMTTVGVVAPSCWDWTFSQVVPIFSTIIFFHGISAWLLSNWQVKVGPRKTLFLGSIFFGGGMILAGLGVKMHFLPLLYLGYGVFSGIGLGLTYVPPLANLIRWFPEKVGYAAGITSCGFGGAAFVASPLVQYFLNRYWKPPVFIGSHEEIHPNVHSDGRMFVCDANNRDLEVVMADKIALTNAPCAEELQEGLYQIFSGSSGAAETLVLMGVVYLTAIMGSSFLIKAPPKNFNAQISSNISRPKLTQRLSAFILKTEQKFLNFLPKKNFLGSHDGNVHIRDVVRSPQFKLLWCMFASLATVGLCIAGTAKDMVFDVFGNSGIISAGFAVGYVSAFSLFNLIGRLFWASFSDRFGKQNTFRIFSLIGFPLCLLLPLSIALLMYCGGEDFKAKHGEKTAKKFAYFSVAIFVAASLLIASIFGGTYATVPAFATELFGRNSVDKVHSRLLTASSLAGILGPVLVSQLRDHSEKKAILKLVEVVDDQKFKEAFECGKEEAKALLKAKSLTISKLMEIAPEGVMDPTPGLYSSTLLLISSLFLTAGVANKLVKKIPSKLYQRIKITKK